MGGSGRRFFSRPAIEDAEDFLKILEKNGYLKFAAR